MRAAALALAGALAAGCRLFAPQAPDPSLCHDCPSGGGCCWEGTVCGGPDDQGYYCQGAEPADPTGAIIYERRRHPGRTPRGIR